MPVMLLRDLLSMRERQVIVRYEGPKGGPGMKELHRITEIIKGIPRTAVITDGRFSGASRRLKHRLSLSGGRGRRSNRSCKEW